MQKNMIKVLFSTSIVIINFVILAEAQSEAEVQYYMELIHDNIERYMVERGPTDASFYIPDSEEVSEFGKFDYIVIGAGSGGAVVASRLSEKKKNKVLLIEAGGQEDDFTDIPGFLFFLSNSQYAWNFKTTPQKSSCLGMVNQECSYTRGRGLGGTTIINALNYVRGNKLNYDDWEGQGNPGWSYKDVLPFFLKSENASFNYTDPKYHRKGGLLNVEYESPYKLPYYSFIEATIERGQKVVDYNGAQQIGVAEPQFNTINGRRDSSNKAFLRPAYKRKNLKIMTFSFATKINIDKSTKTAYGVTFSHNKKLYLARAKKEIILSAGSFHSPQLLMLSGIGPRQELRKHGIPLIQPLPVGSNLHDHYGLLSLLFSSSVTYPKPNLERDVRNYLQGFGDLTFTFNSEALSWFQTSLENRPGFPDIEILFDVPFVSNELFQFSNNYDDETYNAVYSHVDPSNTFAIIPMIMQPKSRGKITLNSSSPYEFPLVESNSFTDLRQHDLETMYRGILIIMDLLKTDAFKKINATLLPNLTHPKCEQFAFNSREYWYCQIQYLAIPFFHPVGTCKMGPDTVFSRGVVDHNLRVHGIKRLRVADASIMPIINSGHTSAPAMMIGEKVSELILNNVQ